MTTTQQIAKSSMYLLFGTFLSGLVVTDFIKEASSIVHAEQPPYLILLLGGFWTFFVIFDTLVWLAYSEEHPTQLKNLYIELVIFVLLLRRSVEFGTLVWIYDIVDIIKEAGNNKVAEILLLERFSFDISLMCFGWFFRRLLQPLIEVLDNNKKIQWIINVVRLLFFAMLFLNLPYLFKFFKNDLSIAYFIIYFCAISHILVNFVCGRQHYKDILPYYKA